ncbi:MAG: CDP-diacylglycerol--serine O-phosphatidyltransferase [Bacteroidales bacterium]|jgi:CDP-diacylglycerol--serine O-phosphatidyltransferase|nr:CDP-diacylglycerol--serine O-phosphatidyltransferase [Bacteroidales bacterium]MDD2631978.1 CDP-diacylglycerol--serine O-phosphatidyltransferase [Bacteroidales bacterium]MDD3525864.1 CDP-diacylglycerol--serine O-phosphatidyltransferase [Bacteroidales bacterium]MDD4176297.1 CDP-diacylglycerol--serine O-phosphatidyltransferase [Bacteroidales bacterium]MDD4741263.1 CDP-diacylglycerol--serine O-phosphatidyltransferase [Bacteroidales bacterium]
MHRHIPNFVTLLNLTCGAIAIVLSFDQALVAAAYFIALAAIFDFMDGMLARLLHAKSDIGLQLDSLADVISFGLAPAFILYQMMLAASNMPAAAVGGYEAMAFAAFLIPAFSALRLARFNIDPGQTDGFVGLPTPANALYFASLPLVTAQAATHDHSLLLWLIDDYWLLLWQASIFSLLMVAPVPLFSLKLKNLSWHTNKLRYIFAALVLVLVVTLSAYALPLIILLYLLMSLLFYKPQQTVG